MTDPIPDKPIAERLRELQEKRGEILKLPPGEALERILDDPQAAALVHSFPESDLYLLVHDAGPEDALPLLALASDRQWEHFVDLESWVQDRFEVHSVTRWLNLMLEADPRRFVRRFLKDRLEFIEFYLFHNIEVRVREHDQDPSEFGEDYFTFDQVYYVRFLKLPAIPGASALNEEDRRRFLMKFLERLAEEDHLTYQSVLTEASHVIPAEAEEEAYHWRNVRLAEKGFVPFDEAVGIYQPLRPRDLEGRTPKAAAVEPGADDARLPVPAYALREVREDNPFSRALARIEPGRALAHIQWEFAHLCNRIIVADRKRLQDREELRRVVAKACGFLGMGLDRMGGPTEGARDPARAAALLKRHTLADVFRLGIGAVMEVKWQAERWIGVSWFGKSGLRLTFWGEQWMGFLGGLLLKRPLLYDNYKSGLLYREFASLADLETAVAVLRQAQAVDGLLARLNPGLMPAGAYGLLTWKNLLLTVWAGRRLGLAEGPLGPLPRAPFLAFYQELLPGGPPAGPRRVPEAMKQAFVDWLRAETGLADQEIPDLLRQVFTDLFAEIESEYGRVDAKDLDPRFVQLFLLKSA